MSPNHTVPIIFISFANSSASPLEHLSKEHSRLTELLERAKEQGLCNYKDRPFATIKQITQTFRDCRGRVAIFHFAGHADQYQLLLEAAEGEKASADAGGMAGFLGLQQNLVLVFLNGCSTQGHVQGLLDAGIPIVISTSSVVKDEVATEFSSCFYYDLTEGRDIESAFHYAEREVKLLHGDRMRTLGNSDEQDTWLEEIVPWKLHVGQGADTALTWNLPDTVDNPLFGLQRPPPFDLPDKPYRYLNWYRRKDADIFFGRDREIRKLYDRVTAVGSPPIVLFYGQSGVGKSSLLAAGLLPYLKENNFEVRYVRRVQGLGLLGSLADKIGCQPDGGDLAAVWKERERLEAKPLVVILDQVEELFTRPNLQQPDELADFLTALEILFADASCRPQGRLILSFRKEWLAEINDCLRESKLLPKEVFLKRLDREGIIAVVTAPQRKERLRDQYGLRIKDPLLPGKIADDLLADRESPVSPMLAILLTDMWDTAKKRDYDHPVFDTDLYHELRSRGLSLDDFLDRQLQTLHSKQQEIVDTGLALDLLAYHTTPLGTAEQRTMIDLEQTYRHRVDVLSTLLQECRDLYLLVDPSQNQPDLHPASRLTHDILAPHVRKRFDESDRPGQRARRVLENHIREHREEQGSPLLDEWALGRIVDGLMGMRVLTAQERVLIDASRRRIKESKPPVLVEDIFPPNLRVHTFIPDELLRVISSDSFIPLGKFGWAITGAVPFAMILWIVGALTENPEPIRLVSELLGGWWWVTLFFLTVALVNLSIFLINAIRRTQIIFNLRTNKVDIVQHRVNRGERYRDLQITYHVKPKALVGFRGELRYGSIVIVRTDVMPTKGEVKEELFPFFEALRYAMGYASPLPTILEDEPTT